MKKIFAVLMLSAAFYACSDAVDDLDPAQNRAERIELTNEEDAACERAKDFAYDFIRQTNAQADGQNYFVSPLSAEMALAMLCNGTSGDTQQEIKKVLGFGGFTIEDLNSYNRKMLKTLPNMDSRTQLALANGLWSRNTLKLRTSFKELIKDQYDGSCSTFDNLDKAKKEINNWCDKHTNHLIKDIMGDADSFEFALVNALYFKGEWTRSFKESNTEMKAFRNLDGTVSQVPMMCKTNETGYFRYGYNDYCHALYMPFGNMAYYFTVVLPDDGKTLDECAERLSDADLQDLYLQDHGECRRVELPRFSFDYQYQLNDMLERMGVRSLFGGGADLSNMFENADDMVISLKQKAHIEVNEKGAKAAAVTVVKGETMAAPVGEDWWEFIVDEPFLFLIRESSTGTVLFSGRVNHL